MELNTTIPLWGVITLVVSFGLPPIGGAIKLWYRVKSQDERLQTLNTRIVELEEQTEEKHGKLFSEIKSLDKKFSDQNTLLIQIKTTLDLFVANKIKP